HIVERGQLHATPGERKKYDIDWYRASLELTSDARTTIWRNRAKRASCGKSDQDGIQAEQPYRLGDEKGEDHQDPRQMVVNHAEILGRREREYDPGHNRAGEDQQRPRGAAGGDRAATAER